MYIIKGINYNNGVASEFVIHDPTSQDNRIVYNAHSEISLNDCGTLEFTITSANPAYNLIHKMTTEIVVERDGEWLYSFRALNDTMELNTPVTISCEGEMSYFLDSIQKYGEYHDITVSDFFSLIVSKHNAEVNSEKQFTVGVVNVVDSNDSLYRYASYENSWDYIKDKLINRLGGYVRTRHVNGTRVIDYVTDYGNLNNQSLTLGKNIVDLKRYEDGSEIATVIIPLGAKLTDADGNETEQRLTIEDAIIDGTRYGLDYLEDTDSVNTYGRIVKVIEYDDVTLPNNLYSRGLAYLETVKAARRTVEVTAVDLHLTDAQFDAFALGDYATVKSLPHGISQMMKISKVYIDYNDPANSKLTLGAIVENMTDKSAADATDIRRKIETIGKNQTEKLSEFRSETREYLNTITQTVDTLTSEMISRATIKTLLSEIQQDFMSVITQTAEEISFDFASQLVKVENGITENSGLIKEYIRFRGALIELGKTGSNFSTKLSNEELGFYEYGRKIAYISGNKLHIVQAEVTKLLTIGNDTIGKYDFIAKSNGNLAIKWRELPT